MKYITTTATVFLALILLSILIGNARSDTIENPFTAYIEYMPGEPARFFGQCQDDGFQDGFFYCSWIVQDGIIHSIYFTTDSVRINGITFAMDNLRYGDMVSYFGAPEYIQEYRTRTYVGWQSLGISISVRGRHLMMTSPIRYVIFSEKPDV